LSDEDTGLDPARLFDGFAPFSGLLLAVSGGPDSMALLRLAAAWRDAGATQFLTAATVDHGLRPDSAAEAGQVGRWAEALGISHQILRWSGAKPTAGIQERARHARYQLLFDHLRDIGSAALVTAHHADDQWETIMIRLARGSGISGLAGMSREQDLYGARLLRPLLDTSKSQLIAYCRRCGQPFFNDPSNADPRFARTQWRELAPSLHHLGLTPARAFKLAERADKADQALYWAADRFFSCVKISPEENVYNLDGAGEAPLAIIEHFLQSAVVKTSGVRPPRLDRLENLAVQLSAAVRAGEDLRATLGGCMLALDRGQRLRIRVENERRRGVQRKT
jgi:tRNA(Ile)-lysidine synthase